MKTKLITIASVFALVAASNGAITLSGTALKNVQGNAQSDLAANLLGLIIVDTGDDGFLATNTQGSGVGSNAAITSGNPVAGATYTSTGAGLGINTTFFGDLVVGRLTTTVAFGDTTMSGSLAGFDASAVLGKNFAIVWFQALTTAGSETLASGNFGIARGGDWTMPAANTGAFSFGTTAATLDQLTLGNPSTVPGGVGQSVSFATNGATLSIVPEPSAALLGAIGVLGLLRRRRN